MQNEIELVSDAKLISYFLLYLGFKPEYIEWSWIRNDKELEKNND